ncbi:MAG: hypothetical protein DYG89_50605 [Caldilinea sp. CFX5]|nr:hypothetical protein [Caldilinea sp. CFX5]
MTEQVLSIPVSAPLYTRLQKFANAIPVSLENLVVQTLEATIPLHEDDIIQQLTNQQDAHQESIVVVFQRMSPVAQKRMEMLMAKNTEGNLTANEQSELRSLVAEYEQIMLTNSEALWRLNQTTALPRMN